jgi:hypothetical protein
MEEVLHSCDAVKRKGIPIPRGEEKLRVQKTQRKIRHQL